MEKPQNVVLLVADSLRWDSVYARGDHRLPYLAQHATAFHQARSGGCWTLPATASMFTGLSPHAHGADSQTRSVLKSVPTLAERMQALGYSTHMITANVATTDIFGLDRGFDTLDRVWKLTEAHHKKIHQALVLAGKPRLRKRILSKDFISGKLSEDLDASKVWLQSTWPNVFDRARELLDANATKNQPGFFFLNLMESHFPYHTSDTFETSAEGILGKIREVVSLFHLVNQTWLTRDKGYIAPDMLQLLRKRQRIAWERIAPAIDSFAKELREKYNATVAFCADHGDNFGEQNWLYHFSNVTDAGNRVPLMVLDHAADDARDVHAPVSMRDLYGTLLRKAGDRDPSLFSLTEDAERSQAVLESFWYNNQGKTLPQYRYNQYAFIDGDTRYAHRQGQWYAAPITRGEESEVSFVPLGAGVNPLEEARITPERLPAIRQSFAEFSVFSEKVMAKKAEAHAA
jgi:arylsulfatase A-like enzyme